MKPTIPGGGNGNFKRFGAARHSRRPNRVSNATAERIVQMKAKERARRRSRSAKRKTKLKRKK